MATMDASSVTTEWLRTLPLKVIPSHQGPSISGVALKELQARLDGRGDVTELWSKPWGTSKVDHVYQSATDYGVVKCWHLHQVHTDNFAVTRGKLQVVLVDLRETSETFGHVNSVFMGTLRPRLLTIPPMIMHGWKALSSPEVIVVNLQSHVYVAEDEFKFPWDCVIPGIWEPLNG